MAFDDDLVINSPFDAPAKQFIAKLTGPRRREAGPIQSRRRRAP
jgi:hypothetical protein